MNGKELAEMLMRLGGEQALIKEAIAQYVESMRTWADAVEDLSRMLAQETDPETKLAMIEIAINTIEDIRKKMGAHGRVFDASIEGLQAQVDALLNSD